MKTGEEIWPKKVQGNLVLASDTAVELGNPRCDSVSFMIWTQKPQIIEDGRVHLVGPDIPEAEGKSLPFGKVVMLEVEGMNEDNCYERHRNLELARYDLELDGYMLRAVSQYLREWSRVSEHAIRNGFSFSVLASELSRLYRSFDFVKKTEFIFITSSSDDVRALYPAGEKVEKRIAAMNKMAVEMNFDCGSCEYTDVCTEVEGLRMIRNHQSEVLHEKPIG